MYAADDVYRKKREKERYRNVSEKINRIFIWQTNVFKSLKSLNMKSSKIVVGKFK